MKSSLLLLHFSILLALAGCSSGRTILPPNVVGGTMEIDGMEREYLVYVPQDSGGVKRPLLLALHGRLETGEVMMKGSGFNGIAGGRGWVVAYPYGYRKSWADGRDAVPADKKGVNDVKFLSSLIDSLILRYNVDPDYVFVCGYSNGAIMANRLSVEITEKLAGMASVEGDATWADLARFPLKKHLPVMFINGTADPIVKYEGGKGGLLGNYSFPAVEQVLDVWKRFNGCGDSAAVRKYDEKHDGTVSILFRYPCADAPVEQILTIGAGHIWPEYKVNYPQVLLGKATTEINASEEIVRFFAEVMGEEK